MRITNEQIREAASELTSERMWKRLDKVILENEAALATPAKTPVEPTPSDRKRAQRWIGKNTNGKYGWTDSLAAEFAAVRREAEERKQP